MNDLRNGSWKRPLLLGYTIFFLFIVGGFAWLRGVSQDAQRLANEIHYESALRSAVNCEGLNEIRSEISSFVADIPELPSFPPEMDETTRQWLRDYAKENRSRYRSVATSTFAQRPCPPRPVPLPDD